MPASSEHSRDVGAPQEHERHGSALDRRLATFADGRSGLVTADELLRAGYTRARIRGLLARGTLHPVHRGVYAVGLPTLPGRSRAHAAVLSTGADAAADWRTASALHDIGGWWPDPPQVAVPRPLRPRAGVTLRRVDLLPAGDVTEVDGVPTLTITRLVLDAAQAGDRRLLERTLRGARKRGDLDAGAVLRRSRHRRGADAIRALLAEDEPDTTNDFERTVYELLHGLGLPEPLREHRLQAFVKDRDRDRELYAKHGIVTSRIPHRDATRRPQRVRQQLGAAAARRAGEVATSLIA